MTSSQPGFITGRWTVRDYNADDVQRPNRFAGPVVVYADHDCDIHPIADCSCNHTCRDVDLAQRNARLIAAAPELYETLAEVERFFSKDEGMAMKISYVLARARGETL